MLCTYWNDQWSGDEIGGTCNTHKWTRKTHTKLWLENF